MCILRPCKKPTQVGVWWRDDKRWCLYSANHQALIKMAVAKNSQTIHLGKIASKVHPNGAEYYVNLQSMEQVALSSGQRRPVMIVDEVTTVQEEQPPQATLLPWKRPKGSLHAHEVEGEIQVPKRKWQGDVSPETERREMVLKQSRMKTAANGWVQYKMPPRSLNFHLHYRDSAGNLVRYDSDIEEALLAAAGWGQQTLFIPDGRSGYHHFDFENMEQRFVSHMIDGRPVVSATQPRQIIAEVPWDATAMVFLASKANKCLRRKISVMVVERFRTKEHLDAILPMKARPRTVISNSKSTCSAALYKKFVDSVEIVMKRFPGDIVGDMIRAAGTKGNIGGPLQIAFKPVNRSAPNVSSRESANEADKSKSAFWMSMAAPVTAAHAAVYGCAVQLKVLAYLVILPISAWKNHAETPSNVCSTYVEVERPEHGLPLAEVTVS